MVASLNIGSSRFAGYSSSGAVTGRLSEFRPLYEMTSQSRRLRSGCRSLEFGSTLSCCGFCRCSQIAGLFRVYCERVFTTETQRSLSSECFLIENSLLRVLRFSVVRHPNSFHHRDRARPTPQPEQQSLFHHRGTRPVELQPGIPQGKSSPSSESFLIKTLYSVCSAPPWCKLRVWLTRKPEEPIAKCMEHRAKGVGHGAGSQRGYAATKVEIEPQRTQRAQKKVHHGDAEDAEFGVFSNQTLFSLRPQRLGGETHLRGKME